MDSFFLNEHRKFNTSQADRSVSNVATIDVDFAFFTSFANLYEVLRERL
jgi:hypothetical protein